MTTAAEAKQQFIDQSLASGLDRAVVEAAAQSLEVEGIFEQEAGLPTAVAPEYEPPEVSTPAPAPAPAPVPIREEVDYTRPILTEVTSPQRFDPVEAPRPRTDLAIRDMLGKVQAERQRALTITAPGVVPPPDYVPPLSYPDIMREHASSLGLSVDQFREVATAQGIALDHMADEVARRGRSADGVIAEARAGGVEAFSEEVFTPLRGDPDFRVYESEERAGLFGTDIEEAPELPKPGEAAYVSYGAAAQTLRDDKEVSRLVDLFGHRELGYEYYVKKRTEGLKRETRLGRNDPDYDVKAAGLAHQALKEIAIFKTVGVWTAPVFLPKQLDPLKPMGILEAMKPTVEIIGVNNKGEVVVRQEGGLQYVLEAIDFVQSAIVGIATEGELSLEAAAKGIAGRRHLFEASEELVPEDASTATEWAIRGGGLLATILFPDALWGAAGVAKIMKGVRPVPKQALILLQEIAAARAERRFVDASKAEAELYKTHRVLAEHLDRVDGMAATRMARDHPDMTDVDLSRSLPGLAGDRRLSLHPHMRIDELAGGEKVSETALPRTRFDTHELLETLGLTKREVLADIDAAKAVSVRKKVAGNVEKIFNLVKRNLGDVGAAKAAEVVGILDRSLKAAVADPRAWFVATQDEIRRIIPGDAEAAKELRQKIYAQMGAVRSAALAADDPVELLARAERAIILASESRAASAVALLEVYAGKSKLLPSPILLKGGKAVPSDLSPMAIKFADQVEEVMGLTRDQAQFSARMADARARSWARRTGRDIDTWWKTRIKGIETAAEAAARRAPDVPPTPTPTPPVRGLGVTPELTETVRHAAGRVSTALPEGYRIVGEGGVTLQIAKGTEATSVLAKFDEAVGMEVPSKELKDAFRLFSKQAFKGKKFNAKAYQEAFDSIEDAAVRDIFLKVDADLKAAGTLVENPATWRVVDEAGETVGKAAADALDAGESAIKKLVEDGVIVRSAEDIEIGHPIRVGPIIYGMSIDAVDSAIGEGYKFEWGAHWIDGKMCFRKKGKATSVPVTNDERFVLAKAEKVSFTHNHPDYSWFSLSRGDLSYTASMGVDEFRVVWPDGTMVKLEAPNGWGDIAYEAKRARGEPVSMAAYIEWKKGVGSYVGGPSTKVANNARKAALKAGKPFSDREWAVAYTEEANKRLVDLGRRVGVDLRVSVQQPDQGIEFGRRAARLAAEEAEKVVKKAEDVDIPFAPPSRLLQADEVDAAAAGTKTADEIAEARRAWEEEGVESRFFKKWFGDDGPNGPKSAVVDEAGVALEVYHGTPGGRFGEAARETNIERRRVAAEKQRLTDEISDLDAKKSSLREKIKTLDKAAGEAREQAIKESRDPEGDKYFWTNYPVWKNAFRPLEEARIELRKLNSEIKSLKNTRRKLPLHRDKDLPEEEVFGTWSGGTTDWGYRSSGAYFTADPKVAKGYAQQLGTQTPYVYKVYLSIKNPFIEGVTEAPPGMLEEIADLTEAEARRLRVAYGRGWDAMDELTKQRPRIRRRVLEKYGFDGEIWHTKSKGVEYIVFDPTQIKSVDNIGTFDPGDPRILFQADEMAAPRGWGKVATDVVEPPPGLGKKTAEEVDAALRQAKTGRAAAQLIIENADNPAYRVIATRIMPHLDDVNVHVVSGSADLPEFIKAADAAGTLERRTANAMLRLTRHPSRGVTSRGLYIAVPGEVGVNVLFRGSDLVSHGARAETVLHELIHAATVRRLNDGLYVVNENTRLGQAAREVLDLHSTVVGHYNSLSRAEQARMPSELTAVMRFGTQNLKEFIAWGMTSKTFQDHLKTIKIANETGFSRFVSLVAELLGIAPGERNVLTELIRTTDDLLDAPLAELAHRPWTESILFQKTAKIDETLPEEGLSELSMRLGAGYVDDEIPRIQAARRLNTLIRKRDAGEFSTDPYRNERIFKRKLDTLSAEMSSVVELKDWKRIEAELVRGADIVREKLIRARRVGDLDPETVETALWLLDKNPALADDLAISIRTTKATTGAAGAYVALPRIMRLFKGKTNPLTAVHEILHHTERMMPIPIQMGIRRAWASALTRAMRDATPEQTVLLQRMLNRDRSALKEIEEAFSRNILSRDQHYQFVNPSEFWAVNGSRILAGRFDVTGTWVGAARQWLTEFIQKIKGTLGLPSDADVLRGLNAVLAGDGTFVSRSLLAGPPTTRLFQKTEAGTEAAVRGEDPIFYSELEKVVEGLNDVYKAQPAGVTEAAEPIPILYTKKSKAVQRGEAKVGDPVIDPVTGEPRLTYPRKGVEIPARSLKDVVLEAVRKGAKEEEVKWTNLEEFLDDLMAQGQHSVTRDELLGHLKNNRVVVEATAVGELPKAVKAARKAASDALTPELRQSIRKVSAEHTLDPAEQWIGPGGPGADFLHRVMGNPDEVHDGWASPLDIWGDSAHFQKGINDGLASLSSLIRPVLRDETSPWGVRKAIQSALDDVTARVNKLNERVAKNEKAADLAASDPRDIWPSPHTPSSAEVEAARREIQQIKDSIAQLWGLVAPHWAHWRDPAAELTGAVDTQLRRFGDLSAAYVSMGHYTELMASDAWKKWADLKQTAKRLADEAGIEQTKFGELTLPGGENYREVLVALPSIKVKDREISELASQLSVKEFGEGPTGLRRITIGAAEVGHAGPARRQYALHTGYQDIVATVHKEGGVTLRSPDGPVKFDDLDEALNHIASLELAGRNKARAFTKAKGSHWDTPNVLVHIRATDRVDEAGRKILYVEEIQSDLHQNGRVAGYTLEENKRLIGLHEEELRRAQAEWDEWDKAAWAQRLPDGSVKPEPDAALAAARRRLKTAQKGPLLDAPFKDTKAWTGLAVKRIMQIAVDEGYEGVAFSRGDIASQVASLPLKSAQEFYDTILPSVVKKHTGAPLEKTLIRAEDADEFEYLRARGMEGMEPPRPPVEAHFVDLKPKVVDYAPRRRVFVPERVRGPQAIFQEGDDAAKAAVEFLEDGRAIIIAYEKADLSSVVHELGHIFRRDLAAMDEGALRTIEDWAGVEVGEWTVEAEEKFARAFERYIREGNAPSPELGTVFARLKGWMVEIYRTIRGSDIDIEMTDEVRRVFDKLLQEAPPAEPPLKSILNIIQKEILGPAMKPGQGALEHLAEEAARMGVPRAARADLVRRLEEDGVIEFPKEVRGKRTWTRDDLDILDDTLSSERVAVAGMQQPRLAARMAQRSIREATPVEQLRQLAEGDKIRNKIAKGVLVTFFGGNAQHVLRMLPPVLRQNILAGTRVIEQAYGEVIHLVGEVGATKDLDKLYRYLGGEKVIFDYGREVLSSGHDAATTVAHMMHARFNALNSQQQDLIKELVDIVKPGPRRAQRLEAARGRMTEAQWAEMIEAAQAFSYKKDKSGLKLFEDLFNAIGAPGKSDTNPLRPSHELPFLESLLYHAGVTPRRGELIDIAGPELAKSMLDDVTSIYNREGAMRAAVLFAGYGHTAQTRKIWTGLGVGVDARVRGEFINWLTGRAVNPKMMPAVQAAMRRFGLNAKFIESPILDLDFYVPLAARQKLVDALARGTEPLVGIDKAFGSETRMGNHIGMFYRFMKIRMTRGAFMLRQRYFFMNTFDHFTQLAITVGFRPAAASTARLLMQDVMVLPTVARGIWALQKAKVLDPHAAEKLRRILQKGGDKAAHAVSRMLAGGKWRIEVNPILEGRAGTFVVGDRVYSHKRIRDIAVQEGIFASFDTTQLGNAVRRTGEVAGDEFIKAHRGAAATARKMTHDVLQLTTDTAEAWAERERLGAMVTLMEMGIDPRVAARLTIDALYDYAGSMSKWDRSWVVSLMLPFWAFQKNANAQIFNNIFSPWAAYRMGVLRRSQDVGPEALTEILYQKVAEPYGIDVDGLSADGKDNYWMLRNLVENGMGPFDQMAPEELELAERLHGPLDQMTPEDRELAERGYGGYTNVPREMRIALGGVFASYTQPLVGGKLYQLGEYLQDAGKVSEMLTSEGVVTQPEKSDRRSHLRTRGGVAITLPMTEKVKRYYSLVGNDHPYTELFIPESTIHAGFRHLANVSAAYILAGAKIEDNLNFLSESSEGMREVRWLNPVEEVVDPARAPIPSHILSLWAPQTQYPRRIHPSLARMVEDAFHIVLAKETVRFTRSGEIGDPLVREIETAEAAAAGEEADIAAGISRAERFYMPPGYWTIAFDNSPFGEINAKLLAWEKSPLEKAHWSGEVVKWARVLVGAQTAETARARTARLEEPRRPEETADPERLR